MINYILNPEGEPVPEYNIHAWAEWFENSADRRVARTEIGTSSISTVFLGIDHSYIGGHKPILWETAVFDLEGTANDIVRCSGSRKDALRMHHAMVRKIQDRLIEGNPS